MNESRRYMQDDRNRRSQDQGDRRQPNWRPSPAQDEGWRYQDDGRFQMSPQQEGYQPYSDGWMPQSQQQDQGWRSQNDGNWRSQGDGNWRSQGDGYRSQNDGGRWQEDWRAQNQGYGQGPGYGQSQGDGGSDSRFGQGRNTGWGARDYSLGRQDFAQRDGMSSSGEFAGRGPKGYARSDDRIREEVSDQLTDDPSVDASEIEVEVKDGRVTLTGTCDDRQQKRRAEDIAERCSGVQDVMNHIRVEQSDRSSNRDNTDTSSKSNQSQSSTRGATGTSPTRRGSSTESM
ncbi:MAG: BON domain-containing protein [Vicinamibacterales bacterium]